MYYVFIKDNIINGAGQCKVLNEDIVSLEITKEQYDAVLEKGNNYYIYQDGELVVNPDYEQEEKRKEEERVAKLTMTALDFVTFLQLAGLTLEQINAYLEANLAVKMQLTYCQNVYCGVACALMPITVGDVTITKEMVILAFKKKNGELE